jgi:hemerythrin superfamily protein
MNPSNLLKQDHRTVKALFRKYERARQQSEKQSIGEQIVEELSIHAMIEEQLVYPILRADKRIESAVLDAIEEHHAVKLVLAELDKMKTSDERYDGKIHFVAEAVETHIQEEEEELLPRLDKMLDDEKRKILAEAMVAMKRMAPNHPHPLAPDTPPGGLVAGIVAKILDTGKDLLRGVTNADKARGHRTVRGRAKGAYASTKAKLGAGRKRTKPARARP